MARSILVLFVVAGLGLAGLGLTACGKRGNVEPPPGKTSTYPKTYPTQ
jgi:hypothetical protein